MHCSEPDGRVAVATLPPCAGVAELGSLGGMVDINDLAQRISSVLNDAVVQRLSKLLLDWTKDSRVVLYTSLHSPWASPLAATVPTVPPRTRIVARRCSPALCRRTSVLLTIT